MRGGATGIAGIVSVAFIAIAMFLPPVTAAEVGVAIRDIVHVGSDVSFPGSSAWGYRPVDAIAGTGTTVTFMNKGLDIHTVTSFSSRIPVEVKPGVIVNFPIPDGVFDSSPSYPGDFTDVILPGASFALSTSGLAPGVYTYFCKLHEWMQASIMVSADGPSEVQVSIVDAIHVTASGGVHIAGFAVWGFLARVTQVPQGTIVVFTNEGIIPHTVTSGSEGAPGEGSEFNSGFGDDPGSFIFPGMTFAVDTSGLAAGEHPYFCDLHPWMNGVIRVR